MAKRAFQWGPGQKFTRDRSSFTYAVRTARETIEEAEPEISTRFDRNVNVVIGFKAGKPFYRILVIDLHKLEKGTLTDWSKIEFDVVHIANYPEGGVGHLDRKKFEKLLKVLPGQQQLDGLLDGVEKIQKAKKVAREEKEEERKKTMAARAKKAASD